MNYIQFRKGEKVTITKSIKDLTASEFDMEENEYEEMLTHIGKTAIITCENDKYLNYVSIEFEDGFSLDAISVEGFYSGNQVEKIQK